MKTSLIKKMTLLVAVFLTGTVAFAQQPDSLASYLEQAARNNPQINADFMLYKASLEKIPQAGAIPDPELEVGFFFKPMETLMGKQVADFTLMQMFPWFGTRKAARSEASEMARMAYEKFRDSRNTLWYDVKAQWYQLSNLNEQYKTTENTIDLLKQLEQLALTRFSASKNKLSAPSASTSTGMGGMSDVLRIQMERAELENKLTNLASLRVVAEARFNSLLNRTSTSPVAVPDSLEQVVFQLNEEPMIDSIFTRNPMLTMIDAEADAYRAKAKMDRRMSYPMIGIGLQYSLINKMDNPIGMPDMNGKDMVMPMVKISLPLFRRKYNAQQRENRNYWLATELKRDNVQNQLHTAYVSASQQLEDAARKITLYTNQYELSLSTWQLIVREFSAGRQSLTDVIQVERQMLDYKLKKSEAIAAYNTNVASIEKLISTSINVENK